GAGLRRCGDLPEVDHLEHSGAVAYIEDADRAEPSLARDAGGAALRERWAPRIHEEHAVPEDRDLAMRARERDDVDGPAELLGEHGAHVDAVELRKARGRRCDRRAWLLLQVVHRADAESTGFDHARESRDTIALRGRDVRPAGLL